MQKKHRKKNILIPLLIIFFFITVGLIAALTPSTKASSNSGGQYVPAVPEQPFAFFENAPVMLYSRNSATNLLSPRVLLPQTYFAQITGEWGDFFSVQYADLSGYVRIASVTVFNYIPKTIYATSTLITAAVGDVSNVNIRAASNSSSQILTTAPIGTQLIFYGTLLDNSDANTISPTSNHWYFVRFNGTSGENAWGYIYSSNVIATPIPPNVVERVMIYQPATPPIETPNTTLWQNTLAIAFAIILSLGAIIAMIIFFKKSSSGSKEIKRVPRNS